MRWKISHGGHDPRQIDMATLLVILVVIIAACRYFGSSSFSDNSEASSKPTFIVPSQSVRW